MSAHPQTVDADETPILVTQDGGVATITLNRSSRMNAMNVALALDLKKELLRLLDEDSVRVLVFTGAGGNFCTGADLKDRTPGPNGETLLGTLHECFNIMTGAKKPSIAAVEGNAYGAGFSIAMWCDYVVAGEKAKFCAPFTGIGLIPDVGLALTLPARIGMGRARRMMFEGLVVQAPQALEWGMIEHKVADGQALATAVEQAAKLMTRAPLALGALRTLLSREWPDPAEFIREEFKLQTALQQSEDVKEGISSFVERRPPQFSGR